MNANALKSCHVDMASRLLHVLVEPYYERRDCLAVIDDPVGEHAAAFAAERVIVAAMPVTTESIRKAVAEAGLVTRSAARSNTVVIEG